MTIEYDDYPEAQLIITRNEIENAVLLRWSDGLRMWDCMDDPTIPPGIVEVRLCRYHWQHREMLRWLNNHPGRSVTATFRLRPSLPRLLWRRVRGWISKRLSSTAKPRRGNG